MLVIFCLILLFFSCCIFCIGLCFVSFLFFFFNDTATTEIYTLSLHDALPISGARGANWLQCTSSASDPGTGVDRKSTRLNSSHVEISYAVFCLKKKKKKKKEK